MKNVAAFALLALLPSTVLAASYVVPPDDAFVRKADGIVVARALTSFVRETASSGIETVTDFAVEEVLKGTLLEKPVRVRVPGGFLDDRFSLVPGAPRFIDGDRLLLFLTRSPDGSGYILTDFGLGQFGFAMDDLNRVVLMRAEEEILDWDNQGRPHREPRRRAEEFLEFIRGVARDESPEADYFVSRRPLKTESGSIRATSEPIAMVAPYTATSYTMGNTESSQGFRWKSFPVTFQQGNILAGAAGDGSTVIQTSISRWNDDCASTIAYQFGGIIANLNGVGDGADGVNNIVWETDIGTFTCGVGGVVGVAGISSAFSDTTNLVGSEQFFRIVEADVSMATGIAACPSFRDSPDLITGVTHELGHTLGFRHSDRSRTDAANCGGSTLECSNSAVMKATLLGGIAGAPQLWDQHAAEAVYPGGSCGPTCTAPAITSLSASVSITDGSSTTLAVTATGTSLTYQWYMGVSGDVTSPISGANSSTLDIAPSSTTNVWVRVSNGCGQADSTTVTVTVVSSAAPAAKLYIVAPCRLLDTRLATGPTGGPAIPPGGLRNITVVNNCGVLADAVSVVVNATAAAPAATGFVTLWVGPASAPLPLASTLNLSPGKTRANNAIVRIGADGTINIYNGSSASLDIIIDVNGFYR